MKKREITLIRRKRSNWVGAIECGMRRGQRQSVGRRRTSVALGENGVGNSGVGREIDQRGLFVRKSLRGRGLKQKGNKM